MTGLNKSKAKNRKTRSNRGGSKNVKFQECKTDGDCHLDKPECDKNHICVQKFRLYGGKSFKKSRSKKQRGGATDNDETLLKASEVGDIGDVITALHNGADVNATNDDHNTALILACQFEHPEIVELLLKKGAYVDMVNADEETALICAITSGNSVIVKLLLKYGADVNIEDINGYDAFTLAGMWHYTDIQNIIAPPYTHIPPCMTQKQFDKCEHYGEAFPVSGISQEKLDRKHAVKLEGSGNVCYDRSELSDWFKHKKTDPQTRAVINDEWIRENMADKPCEENHLGGKRKGNKKTKKTKKGRKTRKGNKTTRKGRKAKK